MRNLLETRRFLHDAHLAGTQDQTRSAFAWDTVSDSFISAIGPSQKSPLIQLNRIKDEGVDPITSWDYNGHGQQLPIENDRILNLRYFSDSKEICLVFSGGDVVLVREDPGSGEGRVEVMGTLEGGIRAASWSPDEEVLATVSGNSHFVLMSRNFEQISDSLMSPNDLHISTHVNVGWGNSATQFKGKRAASMRDPTIPDKIDEGRFSAKDDGCPSLSWRGDSAFIAVSGMGEGQRRAIRIFSRSGELESVSEPLDFQGGPLSWKPSGAIIASVQYPENNSARIVFFEKNGLRHGEFSLREEPQDHLPYIVREIAWNMDSSVLAVCLDDRIQLWSTGNYHWYLKREIFHHSSAADTFAWHPEQPLCAAYYNNGSIYAHSFAWVTSTGSLNAPTDYGQVAVIDGRLLKITPLRIANVPPPMAFREVTLPSTPIDIAFSPDGASLAILCKYRLHILLWSMSSRAPSAEPLLKQNIADISHIYSPRQLCFGGCGIFFVLSDMEDNSSKVSAFELDPSGVWGKKWECVLNKIVLLLIPHACEDGYVVCEDQDGRIIKVGPGGMVFWSIQLPQTCSRVEICQTASEVIAFGLSDGGKLFANSRMLSTGCTSFLVTSEYLVFTTSSHILKFVHLGPSSEDLEIPMKEPNEDERCRNIERGARIITIIPSTFALILQMPRGNLETVFPRVSVLAGIRRLIDTLDYRAAFHVCRTHRVDLNILYDYNPEQLIINVELFVSQLGCSSYLDLFLSQMRNEDLSQKVYRETLPKTFRLSGSLSAEPSTSKKGSKINNICDAFLNALKVHGSTHLNTIITAYLCKEPPDFDNALKTIAKIRDSNVQNSEPAIEHMIFLSDPARLYDHALGLYDIELALLIAERSQRDPREYLPFLQSLQDMSLERKRFTIDDLLGRHAKALKNLSLKEPNSFEEFKSYTIKHKLYLTAIDLFRSDIQKRNEIMLIYANYLHDTSNFKDAGIVFEFLGFYEQATESYRKAGMWQQSLYCSLRAAQSETKTKELASSFAETLFETKDYLASARIYLDYLDNIEGAIRALCRGLCFEEAMRIAANRRKLELVEEIVDVELVDAFNTSTEFIVDCKEQIRAQLQRLRELHDRKLKDPLAYFDGQVQEDAPDNVSLAMTNISNLESSIYTRYTGKTHGSALTSATRRTEKNRRREERKKAKGKRGTVFEAEYLLASLRRLIERMGRAQSDSYQLIEALVRRGMKEQAESIQHGLGEVLRVLKDSEVEIFFEIAGDLSPGREEAPQLLDIPVLSCLESLSILSLQGSDSDASQ